MDLVTLAIELVFGLVFIAALANYLRRRDPLTRDVMFVFSAMAVLFVLQVFQVTIGPPPPLLNQAAILLLLAQPLLTLRVARRLGPMPHWALPIAFVAFAVTAVAFLLLPTRDPAVIPDPIASTRLAVTLAVIGVFVVTELAAAYFLGRAARRRNGSARARLVVAAVATAAFAVAILGAGAAQAATAAAEAINTATRAIALLSAIGYAIAFLPPRSLRRTWQASTGFWATQDLIRLPPATSVAELWGWLATNARRFSGSDAVVVFGTGPGGEVVELAAAGVEPMQDRGYTTADLERLRRAADAGIQQEPTFDDRIALDLVARADARFYTVITVETSVAGIVVALIDRHHSLFGSDDREVVKAIATRTALVADRRIMLAEQERLSADMAATVEALRTASEAKSDFLASMSHELRTPLSAIIGFSELMRGEPGDRQTVSVPREWVDHIHRAGNHLLSLINDVLDLTKVEAGRLELNPEPIDLRTAVAESIAGMRPLADRKGIAVSADAPAETLVADRGRLRQILYNLLSNAIKYTPTGGAVRVTAEGTPDRLSLSVADTGVGISPGDQPHVFEEFRQVGDPHEREPGTGLGLALTRRLVEAHGGTIELDSAPGQGSRFTVHFPRQAAGEMPTVLSQTPQPARRGPLAGADVLVIEDDIAAVRLLRAYLESAGYAVRVAGDGEAGVAEAERAIPAAIVLDVLLPGIDGWEVLRRLKGDERLRDVPVLIVTVVDEREIGLALGAVDYFVKPVDRDALLGRLARYTFMNKVKQGTVRVLAVDDDPAALDVIGAVLRQEGFEVLTADDGDTALEIARSGDVHLVICDLLMPDPDGFAVVAALKADRRTSDIPILILTAHELSDIDKARLNGNILGVVGKGATAESGLRDWLRRVAPSPEAVGSAGAA